MKKLVLFVAILGMFSLIQPHFTFAQMGMMGGYAGQPTPTQSDLQDEKNMQNAGQKIYQNLQNKKITCQQLMSDDYEKLGEYFMGLSAGSTQNHVYWDQRIQQMMGDSGDTQMHIVWGQRGSGCLTNTPLPSNAPAFFGGMMNSQNAETKGGAYSMMGWGNYGYQNMMGGGFGWCFATFHFLIGLVVLIDLILVGVWLWKKIRK
jgi:hypothetical protein